MRIARKFKQLTRFTYPYGTESDLINYLPFDYKKDEHGNYFIEIGNEPSSMFTCHLDTACYDKVRITHISDGKYIRTNGESILGADDKAGMVVLLNMIENNVPGLYYFFIGEESGCIGSGRLSKVWSQTQYSKYIKKVISFDRRGTTSIITEQLYGRCCSNDFAIELANRLNLTGLGFKFSPDDTGVYTDSAKFTSQVPECTNISVGYYNEHTYSESQDIEFLQRLCKGVCLIDWETLPIIRDCNAPYKNSYWGFFEDEEDEDEEDYFDNWSHDNFCHFKVSGKIKKMYISNAQISNERSIIYNWLIMTRSYDGFKGITWDGTSLYIETDMDRYEFVGDRHDLLELMPELSGVPLCELRESL